MAPSLPHWSQQYIGLPYVWGEADCGHLVCRVREEVFGRPVPALVEEERAASAHGRSRQLSEALADFAFQTDAPQEGDIVLLYAKARLSHVGAYCFVDGEPAVLHAMATPGQVVLTRLRDLPRLMLNVEGFYRWKP